MASEMDLRERFGKTVRLLRTARDLSQEQLAHEASIPRNYAGDIERGSKCPSICVMADLAAALKLRPWQLMKAVDELDTWTG